MPIVTAEDLVAAHALPARYIDVVNRWWRPLARDLARRQRAAGRPVVVGINGAQGSGKSTLCDFLSQSLLPESGCRAATLSLDDLYKTRCQREVLSRQVHPLLLTRGVPGTHDVDCGLDIIRRIVEGAPGELQLPRFDKAADDRMAPANWPTIELPVDIVLFEGWCVGAHPQAPEALRDPINALEAEEDADGTWRRYVNDALGSEYQALFARLDLLIMLRPPSFEAVVRNRTLQERKLGLMAKAGAAIMDDMALGRFMQHYERLTRHMFAEMPERADLIFDLDDQQVPFGRGTGNPTFAF